MRNDEPNAMDGALDRALAQYASVEPMAGIEQRVLNRVRAEGTAPRFGIGRWLLAAGCAAAATVAIAVGAWWVKPIPEITVAVRAKPAPHPVAVAAPASRPWPKAQRASLPKQPLFPTPAPISREERTWLALAEPGPNPARDALLDLERRGTEPIKVEPIKIEPLRSDDAK
ncbi:MAG: hypothetical protein ACLP59_21480 [Bryobacteraceae bacterium]